MFRSLIMIVTVLILSSTAAAQQTTVPRFEPAACQFFTEGNVDCGYLVVPEFHNQPGGNVLRLSVAIRRGTDPTAVPLLVLSDGPGEQATGIASYLFGGELGTLAGEERDLILFDQRGVGLSEPALECPEYAASQIALLERIPNANRTAQSVFDALIACRNRLVSDGINLAAFNTVESAADVADMVTTLGYEQVNLMGVSYGSLLAQAVMRDFPNVISSVILDSVMPPNHSYFIDSPGLANEMLNRLIAICENDSICVQRYPNLQQTLFNTIDALNAAPALMFIVNPIRGDAYSSYLTGDMLLNNLRTLINETDVVTRLPQAIYSVSQGDYTLMSDLSGAALPAYASLTRGMTYSVLCADDLIGRTPEDLQQAYEAQPPQYHGLATVDVATVTNAFALCQAWGVPTLDPSVKARVVSDIPTLVLHGEYDPSSSLQYAEEVVTNLENGFLFEFPRASHSLITENDCALLVAQEFIATPTIRPDIDCYRALNPPTPTVVPPTPIADVPTATFAVNTPIPGITLVINTPSAGITLEVNTPIPATPTRANTSIFAPTVVATVDPVNTGVGFRDFRDDELRVRARVPQTWEDRGNGVFTQSRSSPTGTLIIQAFSGGLENAVELIASQVGYVPMSSGTFTLGQFTWTLFQLTLEGSVLDIAIGVEGLRVYTVSLQSPAGERSTLYEDVFLPVLESLQAM